MSVQFSQPARLVSTVKSTFFFALFLFGKFLGEASSHILDVTSHMEQSTTYIGLDVLTLAFKCQKIAPHNLNEIET